MAFTEAQQQLIRSVRENLDIGPDFEEDVKTLNIGNPEEEAEYLRIAQEYADLEADKAYEELEVVRNTGIVTTGLELKQHGEILKKSQSYTVYEVLQQYESPVLTQIQTQLTAAKSKESVEDFCNNIEKVWISYIKGSLKVELPEENLKSMATGLSFYFMDWLKRSGADAGQIADNADGLTKGDWSTKITKMLGTFGQIAGFGEVMGTVNGAVSVLNRHVGEIMQDDNSGNKTLSTTCQHIFTPHGFYDRLRGSQSVKNPDNHTFTFEQTFMQFQGGSNEETLRGVANTLNYTAGVHALMDKVIHEGQSVLGMRNEAKDNVQTIFETIQGYVDKLGGVLGISSVSDALESVGMRGVADFVCLLLGFGSVSGMEKTHREKQLNTELTPKEKDGIDHCLAFARQYVIDDRYMPSAHDDLSSWTKKYGLTTIEGINLTSFPSSPDLVIDSFIEGYAQDKVFPDPRVLQNIPALSSYVTTTTDTDGQQQMIIDPNKADELKNKLQDKKVIGQIIDILMQSYDADFWMKFAKIEEGQQTATPIDCIGLLFATSLAPTQSGPAYKAKALDFAKMGMGVTLTTVVGATLASGEQLAPGNAKNPSPEPTGSSVEKSRTPNTEWEAIPSDKYDAAFTTKVLEVCKDLDILDPNWLMQVMDKETGGKFSPSVKNGAGSGATGLIQFMPSTADSLGTTTDELAAMSAVDQLDYVKKYFEPYTGKLTNLASVYMAVFYPAALSDLQSGDMDKVIFTKLDKDGKETKAYRQNKGMDTGNDGTITIQDITNFVSGGGQKEYFKGKESSEIKVQSIDLAEKSIKPSETVLFGASNAGTVAGVIEDTSSRKGVHSFPGKNSATLKTEAEKIADWGKQTIITSTVNNGYNTDEKAEQAAKDMQAIAQQALNAGSTPVIVLYPNPSNWSDKTVNPNRYEKFQHYNELMKTWCQDKAGDIKPQILDLSADAYKDKFKRDESGYHVDKNVMKQMFTHYLSQ